MFMKIKLGMVQAHVSSRERGVTMTTGM